MQPAHISNEDEEDEEDVDYVPTADDDLSDSEPEAKRVKTSPPKLTAEEEVEKKRAAEALWQSFKSSSSSRPPDRPTDKPRPPMVKIEKRYRFAGEDVVEVKEVPEDSEDAKKWPRWVPSAEDSETNMPGASSTPIQEKKSDEAFAPSSGPSSTKAAPGKRPGPRRPKTKLAPLPGQQLKAKKLTVLDKSAMDWKAHVESAGTSSGLKDELEVHRRGGGYLEKVEFLQRVEERKEETLDANKSGKRRRG